MHPQEEGSHLPDSPPPDRAHLLLEEVYGYFYHHNEGSQLDGGVPDKYACQNFWQWLVTQLYIWYATPPGVMGCLFTEIMVVE